MAQHSIVPSVFVQPHAVAVKYLKVLWVVYVDFARADAHNWPWDPMVIAGSLKDLMIITIFGMHLFYSPFVLANLEAIPIKLIKAG